MTATVIAGWIDTVVCWFDNQKTNSLVLFDRDGVSVTLDLDIFKGKYVRITIEEVEPQPVKEFK